MSKKNTNALAASIAGTLGLSGAADAATVELTLRSVISWSGSGSSTANISSSTATWSYDTVSQLLTQTGGTFNARLTITPTTTIFRHTATGMLLGAPTATASTFSCVEGNFGTQVGASICGNYNFGANFIHETTASWGPGTAFARTIGGDDMALGPQQSLTAYNNLFTASWDGTVLRMSNAACNPAAPGNANGCATLGGFSTGYTWTLSTPVPGTVWLFGSALGALGWLKRRRPATA